MSCARDGNDDGTEYDRPGTRDRRHGNRLERPPPTRMEQSTAIRRNERLCGAIARRPRRQSDVHLTSRSRRSSSSTKAQRRPDGKSPRSFFIIIWLSPEPVVPILISKACSNIRIQYLKKSIRITIRTNTLLHCLQYGVSSYCLTFSLF